MFFQNLERNAFFLSVSLRERPSNPMEMEWRKDSVRAYSYSFIHIRPGGPEMFVGKFVEFEKVHSSSSVPEDNGPWQKQAWRSVMHWRWQLAIFFINFVRTFWMEGFTRAEPPLSRACCVGYALYPPIAQFLFYGIIQSRMFNVRT